MTRRRLSACFLTAVVVAGGGLLSGCKHRLPPPEPVRQGNASFRILEPPASPREKREGSLGVSRPREIFSPAEPYLPLKLPVYPPAALAAKSSDALVSVHVAVDRRGRVTEISPSRLGFTTPGPFAPEFFAAVETAITQWKFVPAQMQFPETSTRDGGAVNAAAVRRESVESSFDVTFTFTSAGTVLPPK
jgi:hypothetical protein